VDRVLGLVDQLVAGWEGVDPVEEQLDLVAGAGDRAGLLVELGLEVLAADLRCHGERRGSPTHVLTRQIVVERRDQAILV